MSNVFSPHKILEKFLEQRSLSLDEYEQLIQGRTSELTRKLAELAVQERRKFYGDNVYVRGLIEISSFCRNNCLYCGLRRENANCQRYRLTPNEILACADEGYQLGFRTVVLQGGEDAAFTDEILCKLITEIKSRHPDCAVTLSLGERGRESFKKLKAAGADRYLLRHETANPEHYARLHPREMSFEHRMNCLRDLKDLGYQTGCGFMIGSPFQTFRDIAQDLKFIENFKPEMCGIGPFIPHHDTPFREFPAGSVDLTCFLLSVIRLIHPPVLLPATTALATLDPCGREKGIWAGANVVMPNLSPESVRAKYELYNGKGAVSTGTESAAALELLRQRMAAMGHDVITDRGDFRAFML